MPVDYNGLGKRIAQYRNRKGLTQEQLGEVVHLVSKYISRVEKGVSRPSLDTIVDIANVLGVTSDMLLQDSLVKARMITYLRSCHDPVARKD